MEKAIEKGIERLGLGFQVGNIKHEKGLAGRRMFESIILKGN